MSVRLSDNTSTWTLQLCSSFLSALTSVFSEAITSEKVFTMLDLSTITTKALQLDILYTVRTQAAISYRSLDKDKLAMVILLRDLNTTKNR